MFTFSRLGSSISCREANQPSQGINAAKRFDITSLPAHPSATAVSVKKRPKPSKDKHKHSNPKKTHKDSSKEGPKIDLESKLNDEPKATEQEDVAVDQPLHHRPWIPYMHRPLHPFHMRHHPHYFPQYMPNTMRFSHPSYWRFQGYFPHFMPGRRVPWEMNPYDMRNIHHFPEYQFGDVQFTQSNHPFRSRPPFRDYNYNFGSDVERLDRPEPLHEDMTYSKNKIKSHKAKEYNRLHEEGRKLVDNSGESKETFKPGKYEQTGAENVRGTNLGVIEDQQALHFNPTEREDEETNYPEYKSEFDTDRFWSSADKRQGNVNNQFSSHEPVKEENAIFRDFTSENQGFDVDEISSSHSKRREQNKERGQANGVHKVNSGAGAVKIKSADPLKLVIADAINSFA